MNITEAIKAGRKKNLAIMYGGDSGNIVFCDNGVMKWRSYSGRIASSEFNEAGALTSNYLTLSNDYDFAGNRRKIEITENNYIYHIGKTVETVGSVPMRGKLVGYHEGNAVVKTVDGFNRFTFPVTLVE